MLLTAVVGAPATAFAGQDADVLIDDPLGALGDRRPAVEEAAAELPVDGLIVSVIPAIGDRPVEKVIRRRFVRLSSPGSDYSHMLLLSVEEQIAVFGLPIQDALVGPEGEPIAPILEPLEAASTVATESFEAGDAGSAALAGIEELEDQLAETGGGDGVEWQVWLNLLLPVLLYFGVRNLVRGIRARRRARAFAGGVTAVRDLRGGGTTLVSGAAVTSEPLVSPVTGSACIYWELSVQEQWRSTRIERGTELRVSPDWRGPGVQPEHLMDKVPYEREVETGSGVKDHGTIRRGAMFYLRDGTGEVLVDPDRAEVTASTTYEGTVDRSDPAYDAPGVPEHRSSLGVRHLREAVVPVDETVMVMGPVEVDGESPQIRWVGRRRPTAKNPFRISVEDPARVERAERRYMIRTFVVAALSLVGIIALLVTTGAWSGPTF